MTWYEKHQDLARINAEARDVLQEVKKDAEDIILALELKEQDKVKRVTESLLKALEILEWSHK